MPESAKAITVKTNFVYKSDFMEVSLVKQALYPLVCLVQRKKFPRPQVQQPLGFPIVCLAQMQIFPREMLCQYVRMYLHTYC